MPRAKRASVGQLNKDIYDAGEDDRFGETPDPGRGMSRASEDVIQKRKIVRVSRRKFGGGTGDPSAAAPSMPTASQKKATSSSNPFASTTLSQPTAMSTSQASKEGGDESSSKPNPFGKISFAPSSATSGASSAPKFSFGASTPAPAPNAPPTSTAASSSLAPSSRSDSATAPKSLSLSTPRNSKGNEEKVRRLNKAFLQMIVDHWEGNYHARDYSPLMKEYSEQAERLFGKEDGEGSEDASGNDAAPPGSSADASSSKNGDSQPAPNSFSFGASAPAPPPAAKSFSFGAPAPAPSPAAKPFSFGAPAQAPPPAAKSFSFGASTAPPASGGSFSFTAKPGAAAHASSAPTFSFGAAPSASPGGGSAPPASDGGGGGGDAGDPTSNPDDGKVEHVEKQEDEEILYEVRAKPIKFENKEWKKYGAGVLRLYRHRVTSKQGMVVRNSIGKVQFHVGVSKGMKFEKVIKDSKKGKSTFVKFFGIERVENGLESFMLQVKPECVDKLHATLEGMVA